ncbi:glycosyltransferase [Shimia sp. MIT1388]|uniref:glycosyltransferase n=1 Tax=Shimia sp. MIT1388 TaxID=3096992 RepID=UPI00399BD9F1
MSVIVPVYNVSAHVRACLQSIQTQTMTDFEVIVVDDGSTDDSGELAAAFCATDTRFRFVSQPNRGLSGARNTGLDLARADVISFVDSDDRIAPEFLEQLYGALQSTGCDWVACAVKSCFPDGNFTVHSAIHGAAEFHETPVWHRYSFDNWQQVIPHFPSAWNKLYRRSLIDGLRYDEGTWFEDHSFFQRAAAQTDHLLHLPRPLYLQTRGREGQITTSDSDRVFEQMDVLHRLRGIMELGPFDGARDAYEKLASRLLFERSLSLRNPARRARFAEESARFLQRDGLSYTPDWDSDISLSWAMEMDGELPLTICIECQKGGEAALQTTLASVGALMGPGFEIFLLGRSKPVARALAKQHPKTQVFDLSQTSSTDVWQAAQGRFVSVLRAGTTLEPAALHQMVEQMLRHDAQVGLSAYLLPGASPSDRPEYCTGFADRRPFGTAALEKGLLNIDGAAALTLLPELSARMFDRQFLLEHGLGYTKSPRASWAFQLAAAVLAPRVVYDPWASITLSSRILPADDAGAIGKGHDILVHALPKRVQDELPTGWQRRLFDRAVHSEQRLTDSAGGARARASELALTQSAARRGLQGVTPQEASFDPPFSDVRARMFDPIGNVAALLRRARSRPLLARQSDLDVRVNIRKSRDEHSPILHFPAEATSSFSVIADFAETDFANINFLQADGLTVPVHLSFRKKERCVVFNHQNNDGWGAEQSWSLPFDRPLLNIHVALSGRRVRLTVDDVSVCEVQIDARFPSSENGALGLTHIELQGNLRPVDLVPVQPTSTLSFDPRLTLHAARNPETHHIRGLTTGHLIPVTTQGTTSLRALLPAHLWRDVLAQGQSGLVMQLERTSGEAVGAPLHISRDEMAAYLDALLQHKPGCVDTILVLTALEHIGHANLFDMLSPAARNSAQRYAAHFGLQELLSSPSDKAKDTPDASRQSTPMKVDPIAQEIDAALTCVGDSIASGAPSLLDVVAQMPISAYAAQEVYLVLGEVFAREDQDFTAFFALAQAAGVQPYAPNGHVWNDTAVLPFLFLQGDIDALLETFRSLVKPHPDWMVTSTVAWVVRHALHSDALTPRQRAHVVFLFDMFISKRTPNYWERAHCRELTLTAVELALHHEALGARQSQRVMRFCVRNYGLSRLFWTELAQCNNGQIPEGLHHAFAHFTNVLAHEADAKSTYEGLLYFDRAKNRDAPRVRRELFGPSGVPTPDNTAPDVAALEDTHWDPGEAALRFMACPGAAAGDAALSEKVRKYIPKVSQHQARSRLLPDQHQAAIDIAKILEAPEGAVDPQALDDLIARCCVLGQRRSNFLGVALCLILIRHFGKSTAHTALGMRIAHQLEDHLKTLSGPDQYALKSSTPVLMALVALQRDTQVWALVQHIAELPFAAAWDLQSTNTSDLIGSPLYDSIVTLFSCKPYLDSRIPPLRAGWLRLLDGLGVPYVVVVGDGDGERRGDVLHLDAPDNYEGLPQKTLAAIQWVHDNTSFAHMVKVDDDCFLNAPLFFQSLTYRKFDYFGRKLTRTVGQLDRVWHQQKSTSLRGRMALDKSPEPSTYADGGSGYALSRRAMRAALSAAKSAAGQELIQLSFMEDKLLGDLLALRGISVADEDYTVTVRRRTHSDAIPVASWQNGFDSSLTAPVHLVHMDTSEGHQDAVDRLTQPVLTPKKIWPSYQKARLGYQSNALELISPASRLDQAREADVAVVACMRNEMFMLPHFLAHYRNLGVGSFLIADNASDDGTLEFLAEQPDVAVFSVDTDYSVSRYGVAWQQALLSAYRVNKWSLVADADELLVWQEKQTQTLPDLLSDPAFADAEAARVFMLDMYPKGPLEDASFQQNPFDEAGYCDRRPFLTNIPAFGPFSDQSTWTSALRHRLIPGSRPNLFVAQKLALLRYQPWMRLSAGMHYVGDARLSTRELIFAHFKYNSDFRRKAETEVARRQHFNNAEEYQKYLALASEGRSVIYDRDISLPWTETDFAKSVFAHSAV